MPLGMGLLGLLPGKRQWLKAEVEARPGEVQIRGGGPGVDRLVARRIRALSTALGAEGLVVAVNPGGVSWGFLGPILIRVQQTREADALCDALAVGTRGHGALEWYPGDAIEATTRRRLSWLMLAAALLGFWFRSANAFWEGLALLAAVGSLGVQGLTLLARDRRKIRLDRTGVDLSGLRIGWAHIPYVFIEDVTEDAEEVVLRLSDPHPPVQIPRWRLQGLAPGEVTHLLDQLRSASLRCRGLGPERRDAESAFEGLRRGQEPVARWLARLDTQAGALQSGAYRSEGHNTSELWEALNDHDAPAEVRVAAARVLVRVQPEQARLRVAELAQEQRDPGAREALELTIRDQALEDLAQQLEDCGLWSEAATRDATRAS
ncbi:MAG: hypothetical protein MUF64_20350 [Polyangiaceae bacterium]|nr:hypothetical protein [Polyangiaceae bacterium]